MAARLKRAAVEASLRTRWVGRRWISRVRTTSTMDDARAVALAGAPAGTVVFAEEQSMGRGRRPGRRWISASGQNLLLTIVVRPTAVRLQRLSMVGPVALAGAVEQVVGLYPGIKWPNDLTLSGRKFAGQLIEAEWNGRRPAFALVGIGVNVNADPGTQRAGLDRPTTSLAVERGRPQSREPLLAAFLNAFERAYGGAENDALFHGWQWRLRTLDQAVTLTTVDEQTYTGVAEGVSDDGALLVRLASGELKPFREGEVTTQPPRALLRS